MMDGKIQDTENKAEGMQSENSSLEGGNLEVARQPHDAQGQLAIVAARPDHSGPINMLSGSMAIFGNVESISLSSPQVESDVRALQDSNAELRADMEGIKTGHEQLAQEIAKTREDARKQKDLKPITPEDTTHVVLNDVMVRKNQETT